MGITPPKLDDRDFEKIVEQFNALVPYYAPGWQPEEKGAGLALEKIFAHMQANIIRQMNRMPEKHFISFLDCVGIKRLPAQPGRVPITFTLAEGTLEHVHIPTRTRIASGEILFETEKSILAAPAKLVAAYGIVYDTDKKNDHIFGSPPHIVSGDPVTPFETALLDSTGAGDTEIFVKNSEGFAEGDLLLIGGSEYAVIFEISDTKIVLAHKLGEAIHLANQPVKKVTRFELFIGKNLQQHILYLGHNDLFNIKNEAEIILKIQPFDEKLANGTFVQWDYWGEQTIVNGDESKTLGWFSFSNAKPEDGKLVLKKKDINEIKEREVNGINSRWIRCKVAEGQIADVANNSPGQNISLETINIEFQPSGATDLLPDMVFYNDVPADLTIENDGFKAPIYPFGMNPAVHDTFYFASQEAFSKKNLNIEITFHLSQCGHTGIGGIMLSWEYWNGNGWNVIPNVTDNTVNFTMPKRDVTFLCPNDIELTQVNGQENYWIRTRIIQGGYSERTYVPFQEDIFIYYDENYPTAWIERDFSGLLALKIRAVLQGKGLKSGIGGARELKTFMETKNYGTVIMAMDVAPDTIYDGKDTLVVKNWLENGGKLIWIGDWEFYYYGKNNKKKISIESQGANLVFGIEKLEDSLTEFIIAPGTQVVGSSIGASVIPGLVEFDSQGPAILSKLTEQGFVYEAYGVNADTTHTDPVLFRRPKKRYGSFVKFHMERIEDESKINQIALELGEFVKNRFFISSVPIDQMRPPGIRKMNIKYSAGNEPGSDNRPEHCLMYNNLQFKDITGECKTGNKSYPFIPLDDEDPSLYLAFDKKPGKGPISIFFSIEEQLGAGEKFPRVPWEYYTLDRGWTKLDAVDDTWGLTRTGIIQFVFPLDFQRKNIFGKSAYWIRAAFLEEANVTTKIKGIFLNTTWATQAETVIDEIIGSGDGTEEQTFTLSKTPVISQTVQVNEFKTLSAEERERLVEENQFEVNEVKEDETGEIIECWVTWKPVDRIQNSSKEDRHYEIDRVSGEIRFGDGTYGKILPNGTDNIKVNYRRGGGTIGNLPPNEIKDIKTSIPFIDKAFNPLPSEGGTDVEDIKNTLERGPRILKHRNRAITAEDFEQITLAASRHIAKVTCLPNYNIKEFNDFDFEKFDNGKTFMPGCVTMIVIPQSSEDKPRLSLQLKREVEDHLHHHAPHVLVEKNAIQVAEPLYIEISTEVTLIAAALDQVAAVEKKSIAALENFLAPLTGGKEKKGWELGRMPCFSDFYSLLENVEGVDHVKKLSLTLPEYDKDDPLTRHETADIVLPPHALVCSGTHIITVDFKTQNGGD